MGFNAFGYCPCCSSLTRDGDGLSDIRHAVHDRLAALGIEPSDRSHAPGNGIAYADDLIPGSSASTATVTLGGYTASSIDSSGDHDWFSVQLTAGQTYVFSVYLASGGLSDSILSLRSGTGANDVIVTNDDANTNAGLYYSEITYTATSTGTFWLDVSGYQTSTGDYYVSVSRPQNDTVAGSASTTATLQLGAAATSGTFELTGDHDWYAVTLTAGETYEFITSATGGGNDADTTITIRDPSGGVLAYNDDYSGTYSRVRFTATTSGTFYVDVAGWAESQSGSYQVLARVAEPLSVYTNDQIADQLLYDYWGGAGAARHFDVSQGGTITVNLTQLTSDGQFLARGALQLWSDTLGITFTEVATGGQIVFDDNQEGAFNSSSRVGNIITQSNVNVSTDWIANYGVSYDSYSFQTYLHEIGHALGLGHGGNYNSSADYTQDASYLNDSWAATVMSYFDQRENTYFRDLGFTRSYVMTPMSADIVAIQEAYGSVTTTRTGDTIYGVGNNTGRVIYGISADTTNASGVLQSITILDNGGTDTLNYSSFSAAQLINLNAETFSNIGGGIGNVSIARGTVIENAIGGSGGDVLIGNSVSNELTGGLGNDTIDGAAEVDTAIVSGNRSAYTVTQTSTGVFQVVGADGTDTLTNVEFLRFSDQTLRLLPGTGVSVNFETADRSIYQSAMNSIHDFDGNSLGGNGSWLRIGSADVNGDGDIDQILVNREIGRFATVGTASDGLVYFDDYSWAGETRVVGIYIDPLVASGDVVQGSAFDSQQRFQNDLNIENINRVLGANDYDHDGLQEVYFALTDGTAYLHAYMHADGNIQYANYQSEQQVMDYLTANGWSSSTWGDWFS